MKIYNPANGIENLKNENGQLPSFCKTGGYPIYYRDSEANDLCPACANKFADHDFEENRPIAYDVHYEGAPIQCGKCGTWIESAYGDPQQDEEEASLDRYVSELARTYGKEGGK